MGKPSLNSISSSHHPIHRPHTFNLILMEKKVLIIEDDREIVDLLSIHLHDLGCRTTPIYDGQEGFLEASNNNFDLIILDIMLPNMDGLQICQKLRGQAINTPILMLTSKSEEIDKILGLETGADDYLTKPFSIREFIARVKAIFRRIQLSREAVSQAPKANPMLRFDNLQLDVDKRKVMLAGKRIDLTPKEFDLLYLLASNPGKSYSRQRLLNLIWGYEYNGYEHTVNSHINRLRAKIEPDLQQPTFILTTWGVGYRFKDD